MDITPANLVLRCYAKKEQGKWQAYCLDLCLAAQADSFDAAKRKLEEQIFSYVSDAVVGEDRDHAGYLLHRKAPWRYIVKYYAYLTLQRIGMLGKDVRRAFQEAMPLVPMALHA